VVVEKAYATCLRLAREHYENFPVASRLVPGRLRPHIAAIYAFARIADDFADEGSRPQAERIALLDDWSHRLQQAATGSVEDDGSDGAQVFAALGVTMRECRLEPELLEDLLSAFRQDVVVTRYETWADLLDYCRRSANPVGRLVLRVAGCRDATADRQSDAVCTALQLTNFWQDLERDWEKGRVYVPREVREAHGAGEHNLASRTWDAAWRATLADVGGRTRALFMEGRPVTDVVRGRLRYELRATWLGGMRVLARLETMDYNVFGRRPTLGAGDVPSILWNAIWWARG
jgi:squalene synthase HpnC